MNDEDTKEARAREEWHLDKRVPITLLVAILIQTAGVIWWAKGITKDTEANSGRITQIEAQRFNERLATLESQVSDARGALTRIESKLDRLIETKK